VEAAGDVFGPLEEALSDPAVGVAGPLGVMTDDLREFREAAGPEVDAVEGYLMAFRREALAGGVAFDAKYRFYRAADIDLSFQLKAMGFRAVRVDVPIRRHEHRAWASTPADRRDALSKRNMYRFLDRYRGRTDLLVGHRGT
jgi:GT2 family glycosyltransferase